MLETRKSLKQLLFPGRSKLISRGSTRSWAQQSQQEEVGIAVVAARLGSHVTARLVVVTACDQGILVCGDCQGPRQEGRGRVLALQELAQGGYRGRRKRGGHDHEEAEASRGTAAGQETVHVLFCVCGVIGCVHEDAID